jgi:threonine synthase
MLRRPFAQLDTPLLPSRSLGVLLGLGALAFKLESLQPTGSWLDREAASLVTQAIADGSTGLCLVGHPALALPLAAQCARTGLRLVVLSPSRGPAVTRSADGWLSALGACHLVVDGEPTELCAVAPVIAERASLMLVDGGAAGRGTGLQAVTSEVNAAGRAGAVLAVPALSGREPAALAALAERRPSAIPLPFDGLASASTERAHGSFGIVGYLGGLAGSWAASPDGTGAPGQGVISVTVTAREVDAARRLLAREEGLLVSRTGAAALAALVRAVREDRRRGPREQRLPRDLSAVVVVTGDPPGGDGPAPSADAAPARIVSLATLVAEAGRIGGTLNGPGSATDPGAGGG